MAALSPYEAIYVLLNVAALTAIRGDRIFNGLDMAPREEPLPFQICVETRKDVLPHMTGRSDEVMAEIDIFNYGDTASECRALADATRAELDNTFNQTITDGADSVFVKALRFDDARHEHLDPADGSDRAIPTITQTYTFAYRLP